MSTPLRLLLIEDSEEDATLLTDAFARSGYDVACQRVETAQALVAALSKQTWDLAISDFTMPRFSGAEALKLVRQRDANLPFIFVSGTIGEDAAVEAMRSGAHDYMMKGNLTRLIPAVERELREAVIRRDRQRSGDRLTYLAYHDALTDLPNRQLLYDRLGQAISSARRAVAPLALLMVDLDGFKDINDTLGHHAGDDALRQVAARLRDLVRESDTVARLGGDEFAMVLPSTDLEGAVVAARRLLQQLEQPFIIDGWPVAVRASVGIAQYPDDATDEQALLQKADVAMYIAKADVSGFSVYRPERDPHTHRRLQLITALKQGIEKQEFRLDYQPIVDLRTGRVRGIESLLRWDHPTEGRLQPADFINVSEQAGLMNALTKLALNRALDEWTPAVRAASPEPLTIGINLSTRSLFDPQLADTIHDLLDVRGVPTLQLSLEITESQIMTDPMRAMQSLTRLRDMGFRLAVDDFGTGYSSLSYLQRFPIDELKIDKGFVTSFTPDNEIIVRSTIDLAHNLGLTVVAEGVESAETKERLIALDCDAAQGYFISRPLSAAAVRTWIQEQRQAVPSRSEP